MAHRQQDLHQQAKPLTTATSLSWPLSILNAFLTGVVGMLAAGFVAAACVDWYGVSSREGESGYFVIAIALLGLVAGVAIGLIVARIVAGGTDPGFLKALGRSVAVVAVITLVGGGAARLLADIPPEINGEALMLAVEVRWPEDQVERPVAAAGEGSLALYSIPFYSNTVRASEDGPLWMEDAHRVDGRWVLPGAVSVFTRRGKRVLVVSTGDDHEANEGFQVPLPARPGKRQLQWSDWLPRTRPGTTPHNKLTYRFRVQRTSQPVRTQLIGDWEVGTAASSFYRQEVNGRTTTAARATFTLRLAGKEVPFDGPAPPDTSQRIDDVALLARPEPAFLVHLDRQDNTGRTFLVSADSGQPRAMEIGESYSGVQGEELTADTMRFRAIRRRQVADGQVNRTTYDQPGLYLIGNAVVDTRRLAVHHFTPDSSASGIPSIPPISVSPDEKSFVAFANAGYPSEAHVLVVTNFVDNRTYILPVDEAKMRYPDFDALDPAWIAHHFEWKRDADGTDRLVERAHFTPLPHFGVLSVESGGEPAYRIEKGSDSLRTALVAFLVARFKALPQPADSDAYEFPVAIGERIVTVAHSPGFGYVLVSMKDRGVDTTLVLEIARQFNEALATGKYDSMFGQ